MNAILLLDRVAWWQLAGWTMVHFLWLGTLIGVAAFAMRLLLRSATAQVRYAAAIGALALFAAAPAGILGWLVVDSPARGPIRSAAGQLVSEFDRAASAKPQAIGVAKDLGVDAMVATTPPTNIPDATFELEVGVIAWERLVAFLPWLWIVGTPLTSAMLATGVIGAERLRRTSRVLGDGPIADACARLAQAMRIGRRVTIAVCERIAAPVLVGIVRPVILLPPSALTGWSPDEIEMVLLHELAHVRRWDNLVNLVQRFVESLLFFHPAVWLLSHWVRGEREACCDAVVVGRTQQPHAYAELLVALAAQMPRSVLFHPQAASAMAAGPLRLRIRRILQLEDDPMLVSGKSLALVMSGVLIAATAAVLYLPSHGQAEETAIVFEEAVVVEEEAASGMDTLIADELTLNPEESQGTLEIKDGQIGLWVANKSDNNKFPSVDDETFVRVPYVLGKTKFEGGDEITIHEIRGTAETFDPGNIYWIKGTYKLGSHDKAMLAAYTTATNAADGVSRSLSVQHANVERGEGAFTLFLPMMYRGYPHVTFYADGRNIGGVYFGTGESILKVRGTADDTDESTSTPPPTPSRFPSLEEQMLADLAWQRMGLELEPLSHEELRNVRNDDYDGGMKVIRNNGPRIVSGHRDGINADDILVGLHVWPTTSMRDVVAVLTRDDLEVLNPLKFYVLRPARNRDEEGKIDVRMDKITGRISVNLPAQRGRGRTRTDAPTDDLFSAPQPEAAPTRVPQPAVAPSPPTPRTPIRREELNALREQLQTLEMQFQQLDNLHPIEKPRVPRQSAASRYSQPELFDDLLVPKQAAEAAKHDKESARLQMKSATEELQRAGNLRQEVQQVEAQAHQLAAMQRQLEVARQQLLEVQQQKEEMAHKLEALRREIQRTHEERGTRDAPIK